MIGYVISFDDVLGYEAIKQLTLINVLILQLDPPFPVYIIADCVQVYLVLLQTVTGLSVYVRASSPAPYYANSKVGLITLI